jgi:hypothetical protein
VVVVTDWTGEASGAEVVLTLAGGQRHTAQFDVGVPMQDLDLQWTMLETKCRSLVQPRLGSQRTDRLIAACRAAEQLPDIGTLLALTTPAA